MGDWIYGDEGGVAFAKLEKPGTGGTFKMGQLQEEFVTADQVNYITTEIEPVQERMPSPDVRGYRSVREEIVGRESCNFTINALLRLNAVGVMPAVGVLLQSAFGVQTIVADTSVAYTLKRRVQAEDVAFSWQEALDADGDLARFFKGGVVRSLTIDATDLNAPVSMAFAGRGLYAGMLGASMVNGAITSSANDIAVDDASVFAEGGIVEIANVAGIHEITGVNTSKKNITVRTAIAKAEDNAAITPFFPAHGTVPAEVVHAKNMYASLDGGATGFDVVGWSIALDNMNELHDDSSSPRPSDVKGVDAFSVTPTLNIEAEKLHAGILNDLLRHKKHDLQLRAGLDEAGKRVIANINNVSFTPVHPSIPERGVATLALSGPGLKGTGNTENPLDLLFN